MYSGKTAKVDLGPTCKMSSRSDTVIKAAALGIHGQPNLLDFGVFGQTLVTAILGF
jgi:hypothetical protein